MTRDRKPAGIGSLAPIQYLILNGVNTNLISRSPQNVLANFLILGCVVMEKGPMYGNLDESVVWFIKVISHFVLLRSLGNIVFIIIMLQFEPEWANLNCVRFSSLIYGLYYLIRSQ